MNRILNLKGKNILRNIFWIGVLLVGFSAFSQTPYNVVMNIFDDPKTKMAFNWFTTSNSTGEQVQVVVGITTNFTSPLTVLAISEENVHKAVVTGLSPGTTYSFRVGKSNAWSDIGTFTTAKNNKDPFSFIYVTDTQIDDRQHLPNHNPDDYVILHTNVNAAFTKYPNTNFWLHCGDIVWNGSRQVQWDSFFENQQNWFYHYPFAPVIGNHEILGTSDRFSRNFNLNYTPFDDEPQKGKSTYTFIYGDAQFFAINSERWDRPSMNSGAILDTSYLEALTNWIQTEISAHPFVKWRIVYFHKCAFTACWGQETGINDNIWRKAITPILDSLNIDIAFFGHDHFYQVIGPVFNNDTIPNSVSDVQQSDPVLPYTNLTGKSSGIFNVAEGTLYFSNSQFGALGFNPMPLGYMPGALCQDVPNYKYLFTGMLGQPGNSTYSNVSVSSYSIIITTYQIINGVSVFLDEISIVKCDPNASASVITTNTVWDSDILSCNDIIVQSGTLTINSGCTLKMNAGKKIIVEPGAKLVVNGGTITNMYSNTLWEGIVVKGTTATPQNAPQNQGSVILNNATIENAVIAVNAASGNPTNGNGGIIQATNTVFRNNVQAINYGSYENRNSNNVIIDNVGFFRQCTFTIDENNFFTSGKALLRHVVLNKVRGIKFRGCRFDNNSRPTPPYSGTGIFAQNAGFTVTEFCLMMPITDCECHPNDKTPAVFEYLSTPIDVNNSGETYAVNIDKCDFYSVGNAANLKITTNFTFTRCNVLNFTGTGLICDNSSGNKIEQNSFSPNPVYSANGMAIINSGEAENLIYSNIFNSLQYGVHVIGNNWVPGPQSGLLIKCNEFNNNMIDIYLAPFATMNANQGSGNEGADNCFSDDPSISLYVSTPFGLTYFHSNPVNKPCLELKNSVGVFPGASLNPNPCKSTLCKPLIAEPIDFIATIELYKEYERERNNLLDEFAAGGYNYNLSEIIDDSSEEYIAETIQLISAISVLNEKMRELSDNSISAILQDTILNTDILKAWYEAVHTPISKYLLAETHFFTNNYEQADAVLHQIPTMFQFTEYDFAEYENYMQFHNLRKQVEFSERSWADLSAVEINHLQTIAELSTGRSSTMAKGVLCFFYDICYDNDFELIEDLEFPDLTTQFPDDYQPEEPEATNEPKLTVSPNPAQTEITVSVVEADVIINKIEIFNWSNILVLQKNIEKSTETFSINNILTGVYVIKAYLSTGEIVNEIFVKQ